MVLRSFDYKIEYRSSAQMGAADILSRLSNTSVQVEELNVIMPLSFELIAEETAVSEDLQEVMNLTRKGWPEKLDADHKAYNFFKMRMSLFIEAGCLLVAKRRDGLARAG